MSRIRRRAVLGALGASAAVPLLASRGVAAAAEIPGEATRQPRPVEPVNEEIAARHSIDYRTLPEQVVGVDVERLLTVHSEDDIAAKRRSLVQHVWKADALPSVRPEVDSRVTAPELPALTGVHRIDRLIVRLPYGFTSIVYLLMPDDARHRRVAFYHNGHGEPLDSMRRCTQALLDRGYPVLLFAMPFYHWNPKTLVDPNDPSVTHEPSHNELVLWETPEFSTLRFFLEPLVAAMNHMQATYRPSSVQMLGLSGGGWATTVYPAIDPRVTRSYPTAGSLPFFLRSAPPKPSPTTGDWEQRKDKHPGFYDDVDYIDMYVMATVGPNRRQIQILNRFDACCFNGVGYRSYESVVRHRVALLGADGAYEVLNDATHEDHMVSPYALSVICWDLDVNTFPQP